MDDGRFSTNLVANIGYFSFSLLVGVWFTPYLISHLGTAAYGLIPLTSTIAGYMSVITVGVNSAVGRFLTIAIAQSNQEVINKLFNTSLLCNLMLVLVLVAPSIGGIVYIENLINIPDGMKEQAQWLFAFTIGSFLLNAVKIPFEVSTFCFNRFDLRNMLAAVELTARVGTVLIFFALSVPHVWHVGIGYIVAACLSFIGAYLIWQELTPMIKVSVSHFSITTAYDLTSMGMWVSVSTIGTILFLGIDLVVVNHMFGAEDVGRYAAVLQWSALLRGFATTVGGIFGPSILYKYAQNDIKGLVNYTRQAIKFVGLIIALPVGLICGFSDPLLELWLGPHFASLSLLMSLLTFHLAFNLAYLPLHNVTTATKNVRLPGIVQLIAGTINLCLAIVFAGSLGWGLYGVAAAGAIALTARNILFTPIYTAYILKQKYYVFLNDLIPIIIAFIMVCGGCWYLVKLINIVSWFELLIWGFVISVAYVLIVLFFLLTKEERFNVLNVLPKRKVC